MELYQGGHEGDAAGQGLVWRMHYWFDALFERLRFRYIGLLDWFKRSGAS